MLLKLIHVLVGQLSDADKQRLADFLTASIGAAAQGAVKGATRGH